MKNSNRTYWQLRMDNETARKGQPDHCVFCEKSGIIGDDLHIFLRAIATKSTESVSFLAACDTCTQQQIELLTIKLNY